MSRRRHASSVGQAHESELTPNRVTDVRLLTVMQAAKLTQLSERQVRRMIAAGDIPVVRFGRSIRIRPQDLGI